jgi:hypothetical protein
VSPNPVDAGHYPIIERRRGITGAAGTMRAAARAVAGEVASLQQQSDVRKRLRYLYNIFYFHGPEITAFTPQPLSFLHFGSRCLIRKYGLARYACTGVRYRTGGPGTVRTDY